MGLIVGRFAGLVFDVLASKEYRVLPTSTRFYLLRLAHFLHSVEQTRTNHVKHVFVDKLRQGTLRKCANPVQSWTSDGQPVGQVNLGQTLLFKWLPAAASLSSVGCTHAYAF